MSITDHYAGVIRKIAEKDGRYPIDAYFFVQEAVSYTIDTLNKSSKRKSFHVSGQELLEGIRQFAVEQFGPMAYTVFSEWRVTSTDDFGRIVFILVDHGLLSARQEDSMEDFADGFDFESELIANFLPVGNRVDVPVIA